MMHAGLAFKSRAERHSMSLAGGNLHRTIIAKVHTVLSAMAWMGVNDLARRILDSMSMDFVVRTCCSRCCLRSPKMW